MSTPPKEKGKWLVITVIVAVLALIFGIWGAYTYVTEFKWGEPETWTLSRSILMLGSGFWFVVGAILWIVGTAFLIMELAGYTFMGFKITKFKIRWDSIDIAIMALTAAVYGGALAATGGLVVIPGFTWIRPANALTPVFGVLFGLPGAIGTAIGNFIADAFAGYLGWGSIGGFVGNFILAYIPYKLVSDPSLRSPRAWAECYLSIIIASVWCSAYISWWLYIWSPGVSPVPLVGLPPIMIWGWFFPFVIINNLLVSVILSPPIIYILYPVVKNWGLLWKDRITILSRK
ncbi:MAG TPA: QueT transporter family protein [Desulfurococcales archaeon]|nr:QueT transporter family protein [Desulfurococcales archaeon]